MKNIYKTVVIIAMLPLSGCSTLSQTFWQRPVIEDVPGGFNTLSLTADRRIAVFRSDKSDKDNYKGLQACAEALPDVAIASDVESAVNATLKAAEENATLDVNESVKQAITLAYQRTETSDLVRQLGWQICQAYLNGAIEDREYMRLLETMVIASLVEVDPSDTRNMNVLKELLAK